MLEKWLESNKEQEFEGRIYNTVRQLYTVVSCQLPVEASKFAEY